MTSLVTGISAREAPDMKHAVDIRNRLLAALPSNRLAGLRPRLMPVELPYGQSLYLPNSPIEVVHFVETGVVSALASFEDGAFVEVGMVGREGLVGLPLVLGGDASPTEARVQIAGTALRLDAKVFREELGRSPAWGALLLRYVLAFHAQVAQGAGCNARHPLEQRLARWLLQAHDRAEGDEFPMTQDFLSLMLGVRRAGVTVAAGALQKAGLIRYAHGHIAVLDRPGLEGAACECYGIVRQQFEQMLGAET
jgi:CRP-like cAMP-binding protein